MTDRNYGEHGQCRATAKSTGERCKKSATGPHGKCNNHGGKSKKGEDHPNYKHGAFSKYLRDDLTEAEQEAVDDVVDRLADPDQADNVIHELVADAIAKYKRSGDVRFLREIRQLLGDFVVETVDQVEVEHSGSIDGERTLGEDEKAAIREGLAIRRDS